MIIIWRIYGRNRSRFNKVIMFLETVWAVYLRHDVTIDIKYYIDGTGKRKLYKFSNGCWNFNRYLRHAFVLYMLQTQLTSLAPALINWSRCVLTRSHSVNIFSRCSCLVYALSVKSCVRSMITSMVRNSVSFSLSTSVSLRTHIQIRTL